MDGKRIPLIILMAALLIILLAVEAGAAEVECAPRQEISDYLLENYGETVAFRALSTKGLMWEWFANRETGTWTALLTKPTGGSCLIDDGDNWRDVAPDPTGQGY